MRAVLLLLLLVVPVAFAQPFADGIDATIMLAPGEAPVVAAPAVLVIPRDASDERWTFDIELTKEYTTFEVRAEGFDLDRARQLFPSLSLSEDEYPLFEEFPNERIWEVDAPARVFRTLGTGDAVTLRLGIPGPDNVTLVLTADRAAPQLTIDDPSNITPIGWYQESRTDELALADLQVRAKGATEWIPNPTAVFHFRQRFPVQGLHPDREYEAQIVATDWSQNNVTSPIYTVRTAPQPIAPVPTVRALSPVPNSTIEPGTPIAVRASIRSPDSAVEAEGVRLFFDLSEVTSGIVYDGSEVRYTPPSPLAAGLHRVSVEARNLAGGQSDARWSFEIAGPREQPIGAALPLAALVIAILLSRRARA